MKYISDLSHHLFLDISIVKSCGFWLIFDDDLVDVSKYFYYFNNDTGCPYNLAHLFGNTIELCISENWSVRNWRFLRINNWYSEIFRNWIHSVLPITRLRIVNYNVVKQNYLKYRVKRIKLYICKQNYLLS